MSITLRSIAIPASLLLAALSISVPSLANTTICQSSASDSDGDGWGWENNKSCKVSTSSASGNSSATESIICESSNSDPDGDGWGWENNRSCAVSSSSNNTPASSPQNTAPTEIPNCESASSDPDNDGWGWENNRSCKIPESSVSAPVTTPTPATPEPPPAVTPAAARTLKVMPVGDSITHGVSNENTTSYRYPLSTMLNNADCQYEYVGSQRTNFNHSTYVAPHEAYYGHMADYFLTGRNNSAGDNRGISNSMTSYKPDVVLLHIGSNDAKSGQNTADIVAEIDQIIAIILDKNSSATVLVANLIPWYRTEQSQVRNLGIAIERYVAQLSNPAVRLVDVWSGYRSDYMVSDNIHPNASGDNHIAKAFFASYKSAGLCAS